MKQDATTKIYSDDNKMLFIVDTTVPLGEIHDFLMNLDVVVVKKINEYIKAVQQSKTEEKKEAVEEEVVVEEVK